MISQEREWREVWIAATAGSVLAVIVTVLFLAGFPRPEARPEVPQFGTVPR